MSSMTLFSRMAQAAEKFEAIRARAVTKEDLAQIGAAAKEIPLNLNLVSELLWCIGEFQFHITRLELGEDAEECNMEIEKAKTKMLQKLDEVMEHCRASMRKDEAHGS